MCFDSSIDSLNKHSIQCIACFDLHINSVDKQDTIHNVKLALKDFYIIFDIYNPGKSFQHSKIPFKCKQGVNVLFFSFICFVLWSAV